MKVWSWKCVWIGWIYYLYMSLLSIFTTNSINILAGINGVEVKPLLSLLPYSFSHSLNSFIGLSSTHNISLANPERSPLPHPNPLIPPLFPTRFFSDNQTRWSKLHNRNGLRLKRIRRSTFVLPLLHAPPRRSLLRSPQTQLVNRLSLPPFFPPRDSLRISSSTLV